VRDRIETACRVESGCKLVGERLIVDKAVCICRADGLFVKALGLELAAFDTGNFGINQRGSIFEILRAIRSPYLKLFMMGVQRRGNAGGREMKNRKMRPAKAPRKSGTPPL
jgi:hypothetical protein